MITPPDDPHPVERPRSAGRWAELLAWLRSASPDLIVAAGTDERVSWLRRQLPHTVVVLAPSLGPVTVGVYGPGQLPDELLPALAAAAAHVTPRPRPKGPPMSDPKTHPCPCGCGRAVADSYLACRAGWAMLPRLMRKRIGDTRPQSAARREAIGEALSWFRARGRDDR
jgi:hypothetical protein